MIASAVSYVTHPNALILCLSRILKRTKATRERCARVVLFVQRYSTMFIIKMFQNPKILL